MEIVEIWQNYMWAENNNISHKQVTFVIAIPQKRRSKVMQLFNDMQRQCL